MPKALKDKWIADLRNPKRKQCTTSLSDGNGGFCCLGRLMVVADGRIRKSRSLDGEWGLPTIRFARAHGITPYLSDCTNFLLTIEGKQKAASQHNDEGRTFAEIADAIERDVEGV